MRLHADAPETSTQPAKRSQPVRSDSSGFSPVIHPDFMRDAEETNARLRRMFDDIQGSPASLLEAMRYSVEGGGKRLRPVLVMWSCDAVQGDRASAWPAALAIELVHSFSLVHDDLPAIDNDELRRGRPTTHARYGEALAILTGDALLAHAFTLLSPSSMRPDLSRALVAELSDATGPIGLIGGEVDDIEGERTAPHADLVQRIHAAKTARLIQAACRMGAIAGGASGEKVSALSEFGRQIGLAFQATDDLLDVQGSGAELGKRAGKDAAAGKQTYPRAVGLEAAVRIVQDTIALAIDALAPLGPDGDRLAQLAQWVVKRTA